ncbi:MAG TPA: prepilin-type N-terminal cleavage/methylation domain-containing protein [bacterium]
MSAARSSAGFTLVELLVSLALTALLLALAAPFAGAQKRLWERQEEAREARRSLVGAIAWVTRDLEQAGYHADGPPLRELAAETLAYVLSRDEQDPAGFSPANRRLVTVWLDGGDLKYRIQAPQPPPAAGWERGSTQVLASGLTGMCCRGLDAAGDEATDPASAASVECTFSGADLRAERVLVRLRTAARRLAAP